jgi:hypothetical protein
MPVDYLRHEFVEFIPSVQEEGILYISIEYATAVHRCCCGCGEKVVTPFTPTDWKLTYDGRTVTLTPSIGNWSLTCRSHYWVRRNQIEWAPSWSRQRIETGRRSDHVAKEQYFDEAAESVPDANQARKEGPVRRALSWLLRRDSIRG